MQPNDSTGRKYEQKMAALKARDKAQGAVMPSRQAIARWWSDKQEFKQLSWSYPACFACGYWNIPESCETVEEGWNRSPLERCHLIAVSEGGRNEVGNIVL